MQDSIGLSLAEGDLVRLPHSCLALASMYYTTTVSHNPYYKNTCVDNKKLFRIHTIYSNTTGYQVSKYAVTCMNCGLTLAIYHELADRMQDKTYKFLTIEI
jgi:hypothetical protein